MLLTKAPEWSENFVIPNELVNVDFRRESIRIGRDMGCCPEPNRKFGAASPIFEEVFRQKVIPRNEWDAAYNDYKPNYARHKTWQYDQDGEGTCTSNSAAGCLSYVWSKTYGRKFAIAPAPTSLYRFCASGPNSGSSTTCIMKRARDVGPVLIDNAGNKAILQKLGLNTSHVIPAVGWRKIDSLDSSWTETASQFKLEEFYEITSVDGFFSALFWGYDILYGRSDHAIHGVDVVKRGSDWACKYDNSWGQWGDQGFGYDTLSYIQRTGAASAAYAFQTMVTPDNIDDLLEVPKLV
jgi:hypothetical protein